MESWHQFDGFILDDIIKWKHFVLLALCAGNSMVTGQFPTQRPVTRSFDVFFDLSLNKRLSKQSWGSIVLIVTSLLWNLGNLVRAFVKRDSMAHGLLIWCPFHNIFEWLETLTNQQSRDPKFVWITFKFYKCIPWHKISDGLDDEMFKATEQRKSMIYRSFCSYPSKTWLKSNWKDLNEIISWIMATILASSTQWDQDKMAAISQNAFSWMKTFEFQIILHWNVFPMV